MLGERVLIAGILLARQGRTEGWAVAPRALYIVDDSGRVLGLPEGGYRFHGPRMATDSSRRLHLLWGESGGMGALSALDYVYVPSSAIFQASYEPTQGWLETELVWGDPDRERMFSNPAIDTGPPQPDSPPGIRVTPMVRIDPSKTVHWAGGRTLVISESGEMMTVAGNRGGPGGGITMFRRDSGGGWTVGSPANEGRRPELVAGSGDELWMAYLATSPQELRVVASSDGGESWSRPVVAVHLGADNANHERFLRAPDGRLHLLWSHSFNSPLPSAVGHSFSEDGGQTWSSPSIFPYQDSFTSWTATVDRCGGVHLVYMDEGVAWHSHWSREWNPATVIYDGEARLSDPALASSPATGTLYMAANALTRGEASDSIQRFDLVEMTLTVHP